MRMIHFIDPLGVEKNPNLPAEIKENYEMRMIQLNDRQNAERAGVRLRGRSNAAWGRFKRWLLVFLHRKRL